MLNNHCCPYIEASHCKYSHYLHIKNDSKSNTNSTSNLIFTKNFNYLKIYFECADNGGHCKIVSTIKKLKFAHIISRNKSHIKVPKSCHTTVSLMLC